MCQPFISSIFGFFLVKNVSISVIFWRTISRWYFQPAGVSQKTSSSLHAQIWPVTIVGGVGGMLYWQTPIQLVKVGACQLVCDVWRDKLHVACCIPSYWSDMMTVRAISPLHSPPCDGWNKNVQPWQGSHVLS